HEAIADVEPGKLVPRVLVSRVGAGRIFQVADADQSFAPGLEIAAPSVAAQHDIARQTDFEIIDRLDRQTEADIIRIRHEAAVIIQLADEDIELPGAEPAQE